MKKKSKNLKWYDSAEIVTNNLIVVIIAIIICSQSFVLGQNLSLQLFGSIINHNSIYLLVLVYFILLKFNFGKKYFNYLNVVLMLIYFISTFTSLLTVVQSFSLNSVLDFMINFIILIYMFHTMFRDTLIWKEYKLSSSPFNVLSNEEMFYGVAIIGLFLLVVNLVSTVIISGVIISILDTIYLLLFGRYIYLYREYLDFRKLDSNNTGNFDEITKTIKENVEDVTEKVKDIIDEVNIDETINTMKEKAVDVASDIKDNVKDFIEKNELDKNFDNLKEKIHNKVSEEKEDVDIVDEKKKSTKKDSPSNVKKSNYKKSNNSKTDSVSKKKDSDKNSKKNVDEGDK